MNKNILILLITVLLCSLTLQTKGISPNSKPSDKTSIKSEKIQTKQKTNKNKINYDKPHLAKQKKAPRIASVQRSKTTENASKLDSQTSDVNQNKKIDKTPEQKTQTSDVNQNKKTDDEIPEQKTQTSGVNQNNADRSGSEEAEQNSVTSHSTETNISENRNDTNRSDDAKSSSESLISEEKKDQNQSTTESNTLFNWLTLSFLILCLVLILLIAFLWLKYKECEKLLILDRKQKCFNKNNDQEKVKIKNLERQLSLERNQKASLQDQHNALQDQHNALQDQYDHLQAVNTNLENELQNKDKEYEGYLKQLAAEKEDIGQQYEELNQKYVSYYDAWERSQAELKQVQDCHNAMIVEFGEKSYHLKQNLEQNTVTGLLMLSVAKIETMKKIGVKNQVILREFQYLDNQIALLFKESAEMQTFRKAIHPLISDCLSDYKIVWPAIDTNIAEYPKNELDLSISNRGTTIEKVKCAAIYIIGDSDPFQRAIVECK